MKSTFKSKALEANLTQTKQDQIDFPEKHHWFLSLSASYWGINKKTENFIKEYNHAYPDYAFIIKSLHKISVNDLWLYNSVEESEEALLFLVDIFEELQNKELEEKLQEQLVRTLFVFVDKLAKEENYPPRVIWKCLDLIEQGMAKNEEIYLRNARHFKMYLRKLAKVPEFNQKICEITKEILRKSCAYWENTTNIEEWIESKSELFLPESREKIKQLGKIFFKDLSEQIEASQEWNEIESNLFFEEIANYYRHFIEELELSIEKIYYLLYLLHLPGMIPLKNHLLYDLNRLLKTVLAELANKDIYPFIDIMFNLFIDLREQHTGTILDCQLTLGKEIAAIEDQEIINHYIEKLIEFGFVFPGKIEITDDWVTKANPNHVKNIRVWLELIGTSPYNFKKLLSALLVNLKLGGIFISDTDLFQRDITKLLNANIGSVFKQVKQLARVFPVYYNEIGAEGDLRDYSTAIDELSGRKDRLMHFVRKQIHAESNNMHVELIKKVAGFWYNGDLKPLQAILPSDVIEFIDVESEYFVEINFLMNEVCEHFNVDFEGLLKLPEDEVAEFIQNQSSVNERDKKRLIYLLHMNKLLLAKYSLEANNIIDVLSRSNFFQQDDIKQLQEFLEQNLHQQALEQVYAFMEDLNEIILDDTITEPVENIYYKRHIAIGIPSMYGEYREPKFEALGLIYRLEQLASHLFERLLKDLPLENFSPHTLDEVYALLVQFKKGLELDGIVNQNFNSTLEMIRHSLFSPSVTLGQYINIFRFMSGHIKEAINKYFMRFYDEALNIVVPQIYDDSAETLMNVSEIFYRDILSSSFLMQELDNFLANLINVTENLIENKKEVHIHTNTSYKPELAISPLTQETLPMDNRIFLGAKAYYLKKMSSYNLPIPPGFVLTTEVYRHKQTIFKNQNMLRDLENKILSQVHALEISEGLQFGSVKNPLLLSVRSGTAFSMPGAMITLLNVGMNDAIAEELGKNAKTAWMSWDSYRRFIQSWGMAYGIDRDLFDEIMAYYKKRYNVKLKSFFNAMQMKEIAKEYKKILNKNNVFVAEDSFEQLKQAISIVFDSWSSKRANAYRKHMQIADEWGTAVTVQKMVMGNRSRNSGTGVVFTHDPKLNKPGIHLYGDFTTCSQGEDIVSGLVYTMPVSERQRINEYQDSEFSLESAFPEIFQRLYEIAAELIETHGFNHQQIEFTFESPEPEDLYLLQTREQEITPKDKEVSFNTTNAQGSMIGKGIGVGGGLMKGIVSFYMEDLQENKNKYPEENHILIRPDTVPDDIHMIFISDGLVTSRGGITSHAAVSAQKLGKVCIVNCKELKVDETNKECTINNVTIKSGATIYIDGQVGSIHAEDNQLSFSYQSAKS